MALGTVCVSCCAAVGGMEGPAWCLAASLSACEGQPAGAPARPPDPTRLLTSVAKEGMALMGLAGVW